jgi:hypothetical protein
LATAKGKACEKRGLEEIDWRRAEKSQAEGSGQRVEMKANTFLVNFIGIEGLRNILNTK